MAETTSVELQNLLVSALLRLAGSIATVIIGRWLARLARRSIRVALARTKATHSIIELVERLVYYVVLLSAICIALGILGIPINVVISLIGFVLILAAVALRETLSDFAATVIFIVFQPFKAGDLIETNDLVGHVEEVLMFTTVLITMDNRKVIIPNGTIQNNKLINYSALETIRLDLPVSVSYTDDMGKAKEALLEIANADARVLHEPAPVVDVMELANSGVIHVLRVYTKSDDYWALRPALNERIKLVFDQRRLTIPFPQLDLHLSRDLLEQPAQPASNS